MKTLKRIAAVLMAFAVSITAGASALAAEGLQTTSVSKECRASVQTVAAPKSNIDPGTYTNNLYVKLTCSTSGARIFYTTDGSVPTTHSNEYTSYIRIKGTKGKTETVVIRAIAVKTGYDTSDVVDFYYQVALPADPDVEYMEIQRAPTKTRYKKGDELNLTGGKIIVSYADGTYNTITMTEDMISGFNTNTAGQKTVTVTYEGFTDSFTINVSSYSSGSSSDSNSESDNTNDNDKDDMQPQLSGTTAFGWDEISEALKEYNEGDEIIVVLNGSFNISKDMLRAAAKKKLNISFFVEQGMKWKLNTAEMNTETIRDIGLGIRTSALSMLETTIKSVGGNEAARFHINSDNKVKTKLNLDLGKDNGEFIASLFRYNNENNTMILIDTALTDKNGVTDLVPDLSGDYVVIVDSETKIPGDLNNDLNVDALDASILLRKIVTESELDVKCDFNKDGIINVIDVASILKAAI